MHRYRDMFKGVAEANAHFSELFVGMGLVQLSISFFVRSRELHFRRVNIIEARRGIFIA